MWQGVLKQSGLTLPSRAVTKTAPVSTNVGLWAQLCLFHPVYSLTHYTPTGKCPLQYAWFWWGRWRKGRGLEAMGVWRKTARAIGCNRGSKCSCSRGGGRRFGGGWGQAVRTCWGGRYEKAVLSEAGVFAPYPKKFLQTVERKLSIPLPAPASAMGMPPNLAWERLGLSFCFT